MKPQMWIWRQVWTCSHSKKRSMSLPSMVSLWATWRLRPPLGLALPLPHTPGQCCFSPAKLTRSMKPQLQLWSLELLSLLQRGELEATSLVAIPEVAMRWPAPSAGWHTIFWNSSRSCQRRHCPATRSPWLSNKVSEIKNDSFCVLSFLEWLVWSTLPQQFKLMSVIHDAAVNQVETR